MCDVCFPKEKRLYYCSNCSLIDENLGNNRQELDDNFPVQLSRSIKSQSHKLVGFLGSDKAGMMARS